jgi:hypothetical protein
MVIPASSATTLSISIPKNPQSQTCESSDIQDFVQALVIETAEGYTTSVKGIFW